MFDSVRDDMRTTLDEIRAAGLHKPERVIGTPQSATVAVTAGGRPGEVLNFCANNYLGLADHPEVIAAAHEALDRWGYGMASVRFICGTQEVHKELEQRLSTFLGQEDTILYSSCFDANGGVFETVLGPDDAVISDALNHASIIDGIRLSKAKRFRYANRDMADLETQLKEASGARQPSSSSPTASSPWTDTSPRCARSATWPSATTRWSWSTTRTPSASSVPAAAARPSCTT